MRINIAASHRFHLLDLARELESLGHKVCFYSYVPSKRALKFGLKKESSYSLFYLMLPFLAMVKLTKSSSWSIKMLNRTLDLYLSLFMKPCDVYIALGVVYKSSFISAKKRFGATTIVEWGSKHIVEQQRILSEIPELKQQDYYFTKRAIDAYNLADYIAIASNHVKQSFIENGIAEKKMLQNPYGVDLSMFKPTRLVSKDSFDVIMVGGWSYRKGCDLLIDFFQNSNLKFLHVGSIVDLPFPSQSNMKHIDSVDQKKLINYYAQAKVFVLVSREEGLAMVQPQAVACGLPIVCSKHTGGRDLNIFLEEKKWIIEMKEFSTGELEKCLNEALNLAKTQNGLRSFADNISESLNWKAYGKRYGENLKKITK